MKGADVTIGEPRRPLLGSRMGVPLLLILAACAGILYFGHQVARGLEESVAASARAGGRATAHEIAGFIDREHERLRAFTEEKDAEIRNILGFPDNWPAIDALQTSVKRMFRGAFAFTITGPDGQPLFEDFDGLVGPVCQAAMREYVETVAHTPDAVELPPIHPVPGAFHFDLVSPWQLDDGRSGVFFISMSPDRIAELIAAAEKASGTRIVLVNRDEPTLIEVTGSGARDTLGGDFRLEAEQLTRGHFITDLPGTHWRLVVLPDAAALGAAVSEVYTKVAALVVALLLISAALLLLIRRAEQRNSSVFMRSLQSSVSRQRAILQSMVDGMVTIDARGQILNTNNAITRLFGYEADELIGLNVRVLMPEPDRSAHDGYLANYLATGESKILGKGREVMARRKDGSLFPALLTLGESVEGDEHIFVGILHDMTAYNEAQRKIVAQAVAIKRSKQELDEISQIASKDLQAPLQRIASLGERLGSDRLAALSGVERAQLKSLGDEARGMSELVKGIAEYTRAEGRPRARAVDLGDVLDGVRKDLASRIAGQGAKVSVDVAGMVQGDAKQLRQVFWNLVDNALKFSEPGRAPEIRVDMAVADDASPTVTVRVADNGIGIPADQHEAVFEAFKRLHPREQYPGMGLGLSFCRKIVDGLGGSIRVASSSAEGSVFEVILPRPR